LGIHQQQLAAAERQSFRHRTSSSSNNGFGFAAAGLGVAAVQGFSTCTADDGDGSTSDVVRADAQVCVISFRWHGRSQHLIHLRCSTMQEEWLDLSKSPTLASFIEKKKKQPPSEWETIHFPLPDPRYDFDFGIAHSRSCICNSDTIVCMQAERYQGGSN
jgi:hypothetical protein